MEHSWRWFGPEDPISLEQVRQTGATGVVTALGHVPPGEVWLPEDIEQRKNLIERAGLTWTVVESVPVHDDIKRGGPKRAAALDNYRQTLRNLGAAGIRTVVYNFMPLLDWTRTDLATPLDTGGTALSFDWDTYVAFDLFILGREPKDEYTPRQIERAEALYGELDDEEVETLTQTMLAGMPGAVETFTLGAFREALATYAGIGPRQLKHNLDYFLKHVLPVAEECGVNLAIHPDDPPFSLFGLPRIVSTQQDARDVLSWHPTIANGLTLCVGSFASDPKNNVDQIAREFLPRTHFVHLRNVTVSACGFVESDHLHGDIDMVKIISLVVEEEAHRSDEGLPPLPMRPDHGHAILDDLQRRTQPGYSLAGRLRGLSQLAGVEQAVRRLRY